MVQASLSTSTNFDGDLNALVEDQGTEVIFRVDLDEAAPAGGTRVYIDSETVQIFNRLDLPAAISNPQIENVNLLSVRTNIDDSGLAFTINQGATFATITLAIFDNPEPDTFLPETFDGRVDATFSLLTEAEIDPIDFEAITVNGVSVSDVDIDPEARDSVVIFVDDESQLPDSTIDPPLLPTVGITLDQSDVVEGETIVLTVDVEGEIPSDGLTVLINDVASAENEIIRSLTEFDIANVVLTGISGFPLPAEGDSGFFVTIAEPTATITLPVLDDGFDEDEANEVFTFEVIEDETYEIDTNASSVTISITDNEVAENPRISDFEDGTVQGWTVGQPGNHFAPPVNIPSGGPDGDEDNYLRTQSEGGNGVGSRLVWFNQSADWRGNYIEDGNTIIEASLINEGTEDVVIRVAFDGPGGRFVTTEGITLAPGSGWQEATFDIEPEDLTADGGTDVEATLSDVSQIRFLNSPNPSYRGFAEVAQVGVDNITFTSTPTDTTPLDLLDTPFIRFQNSDVPGTYLYATGEEADSIRENSPNFIEEGVAFNAAIAPDDELIVLNRFQNSDLPGTYLFAGEEESQGIRDNFPNFIEEGVAFYAYGAGAGEETPFSRFQNSDVPGTYLYATGAEADNIRANFPNFIDEGIAFEAAI
ncbi:MAG: hypothetical protein AAGA80_25780 [Cyanobacteria bacterium P01_F01_bin.143]